MNRTRDKSTETWLNDQKVSSRYTYKTIWKKFMSYVNMTGDQILEDRKTDNKKRWENKVKAFNEAMRKEYSSNYVVTMMGTIRSFFTYFEVDLKFRKSKSRQLVEASRKTRDYLFTTEELFRMYEHGDVIDKYVVAVGKSFGLRAIDFIALTRGDLEPYINREVPISVGEFNTIKANVRAYPFIDYDAQKAIRLMLQKMSVEGRTGPEEKMLTFEKNQLSARLQNLARKAGIVNNGEGRIIVRFHTLRKFLFDRLTSVTSDTKAKMIVGKAISEGAYVSPELLREDYKRVSPLTSFRQNNRVSGEVQALKERISELEDMVEQLWPLLEESDRRRGYR